LLGALAAGHGQQWTQVAELLIAFGLSSVVGLEREFRGKSAGLRTQTIVGTAAALFVLVSKYGFGDVLAAGHVVLDPSRVAAQVVSGVGFLGAGLIITRRGAIRGLTTAASVWETAAIGMAAGAGLPLLALLVTALHFVTVAAYTPLGRWLATRGHGERTYRVTYEDGRGVLRALLATCTEKGWSVNAMVAGTGEQDGSRSSDGLVSVGLTLAGSGAFAASGDLAAIEGVVRVDLGDEDD